jgi:hypothetical protein
MFFHCLCKYWDFHLGFGCWLHSHGDISGTITSMDDLAWHLARSGKGIYWIYCLHFGGTCIRRRNTQGICTHLESQKLVSKFIALRNALSLALYPDPSKLSADPFCIKKRGELEFKLNSTIRHQQGTDSTSTFRTAVRDVPEADSKVSV